MTYDPTLDGPRRQRMAGYRPLATTPVSAPTPTPTPTPNESTTEPPGHATPQPAALAPSSPLSAPVRRRMAGYRPLASYESATRGGAPHPTAPVEPSPAPAAGTYSAAVTAAAAPPQTLAAHEVEPSAAPGAAGPKQRMAGYRPLTAAAPPVVAPLLDLPPAPAAPAAAAAPLSVKVVQPSVGAAPLGGPTTGDPVSTPPAERASVARRPRPAWVTPVVRTLGVVLLAVLVVLCARWLRTLAPVEDFLSRYDGHASQPATAPTGLPRWLGWQHFLNMFLMVLIVRTGLQVRRERKAPAYWTARPNSFFSPRGNTPKKVSLTQWLHQSLDVLWVLNGLVFIVLLFATGQWMRIVPTSWDTVPHVLSTALQYASLDWPTENGWIHYNALQVVSYCVTVFVAAPLAVISGLRFSTWWPERATTLNRLYPVEWARAIHVPVMLYFVGFTIIHVFLVFFTGALRNLNHMYTSRDVVDGWGLLLFGVSVLVIAAGWFLSQPLFTTPLAGRLGKVSK